MAERGWDRTAVCRHCVPLQLVLAKCQLAGWSQSSAGSGKPQQTEDGEDDDHESDEIDDGVHDVFQSLGAGSPIEAAGS